MKKIFEKIPRNGLFEKKIFLNIKHLCGGQLCGICNALALLTLQGNLPMIIPGPLMGTSLPHFRAFPLVVIFLTKFYENAK